jgi:hypothetical protein
MLGKLKAGNNNRERRLSAVDLLIKVAFLLKKGK